MEASPAQGKNYEYFNTLTFENFEGRLAQLLVIANICVLFCIDSKKICNSDISAKTRIFVQVSGRPKFSSSSWFTIAKQVVNFLVENTWETVPLEWLVFISERRNVLRIFYRRSHLQSLNNEDLVNLPNEKPRVRFFDISYGSKNLPLTKFRSNGRHHLRSSLTMLRHSQFSAILFHFKKTRPLQIIGSS